MYGQEKRFSVFLANYLFFWAPMRWQPVQPRNSAPLLTPMMHVCLLMTAMMHVWENVSICNPPPPPTHPKLQIVFYCLYKKKGCLIWGPARVWLCLPTAAAHGTRPYPFVQRRLALVVSGVPHADAAARALQGQGQKEAWPERCRCELRSRSTPVRRLCRFGTMAA